MALIDIDATSTGVGDATASLAVLTSLSESVGGAGGSNLSVGVMHNIPYLLLGGSNISGSSQATIDFSGYTGGSGDVIDARLLEASGLALGGSLASGSAVRVIGLSGYAIGSGTFGVSVPEPIYGVAIVTAYMEVIHVPLPICETPQVEKRFRWGHQFGRGDLDIHVIDSLGNPLGPVCISYTMYQLQKGCAPKQYGPSGRKPGTERVGTYYATGTAGECGQPGLWIIRWSYQRSFGESPVVKDCYFWVLDSVLCPVPGDTLPRNCKYGWD